MGFSENHVHPRIVLSTTTKPTDNQRQEPREAIAVRGTLRVAPLHA